MSVESNRIDAGLDRPVGGRERQRVRARLLRDDVHSFFAVRSDLVLKFFDLLVVDITHLDDDVNALLLDDDARELGRCKREMVAMHFAREEVLHDRRIGIEHGRVFGR
jgi:hypothetical protein